MTMADMYVVYVNGVRRLMLRVPAQAQLEAYLQDDRTFVRIDGVPHLVPRGGFLEIGGA